MNIWCGKRNAPQTHYIVWTPNTVRSSISDNQLYNAAPYLAAQAIGYGLRDGSDEQGVN